MQTEGTSLPRSTCHRLDAGRNLFWLPDRETRAPSTSVLVYMLPKRAPHSTSESCRQSCRHGLLTSIPRPSGALSSSLPSSQLPSCRSPELKLVSLKSCVAVCFTSFKVTPKLTTEQLGLVVPVCSPACHFNLTRMGTGDHLHQLPNWLKCTCPCCLPQLLLVIGISSKEHLAKACSKEKAREAVCEERRRGKLHHIPGNLEREQSWRPRLEN